MHAKWRNGGFLIDFLPVETRNSCLSEASSGITLTQSINWTSNHQISAHRWYMMIYDYMKQYYYLRGKFMFSYAFDTQELNDYRKVISIWQYRKSRFVIVDDIESMIPIIFLYKTSQCIACLCNKSIKKTNLSTNIEHYIYWENAISVLGQFSNPVHSLYTFRRFT